MMEEPSEAHEAAAGTEVPVGGETGKVKAMKVLVAVDESDGSLHALSWALDDLFATGGDVDHLVLLNVQQPIQQFVFPPGPAVYTTAGVVDSVKKAQQQNSEALLARATQMCRSKHVNPQCVIMEGDPKETICQAVENMHVDLAVVGSRGLGKVKRAFLGSVSDYCVHHAKCPILIVKPLKNQHQQHH